MVADDRERQGKIVMQHLPTVKNNLRDYINAGFPILYINTHEEEKIDQYIADAADRREVIEWNGANGYVNFKTKSQFQALTLETTLTTLCAGKKGLDHKLLVIKDAAEQLNPNGQHKSDKVIALLKEIARKIRNEEINATVIIVSSALHIPQELEKLITVLDLGFPDESEISQIINQFTEKLGISTGPADFRSELVTAFKGLSESEIKDILSLAISRDGKLTKKALQLIFDQKQQMILKAGILEMIPLKESISDIGGLEILKDWLQKKAAVFKDMEAAKKFGVAMPKGVLIAGVPGCGKSMTAKAAGSLFNVPLLRLDMGRLMGKYVGESEENMRKATQLAEAISPCVLWVDELEKAFAGIGGSGGGAEVTTRLFGAFLTWMQEKDTPAFVVATANDITQLPPELLRKGRFDEIFSVALPTDEERKKIFEIHLNKRRKSDIDKIDIDKLVGATKGYSGADIEGVVSESIENAFVKGSSNLTTDDVLECIRNTHPISEVMKDSIDKMSKTFASKKIKKASK